MPNSAYIHIPFCAHKCDFCDFVAFAGLDHLHKQYCQVVCKEIQLRVADYLNKECLQSVFYGGGTPGLIDANDLGSIHQQLSEAIGFAEDVEITLESTPTSFTSEKITAWSQLGINRLSVGVESLQDVELKAMGRGQTRSDVLAGIKLVQDSGFQNVSIDLMYGLPEQSLSSWSDTLAQALSFSFPHLSAYGLTIASNSPLLTRYPKASSAYPDDDNFADMYEMLVSMCEKQGLKQYEISNFAVPGYESKHNLAYWNNEEYYAFGVGAHRYVNGIRSHNWRSMKHYMEDYLGNENSEAIDAQIKQKETIFLALRTRRGLDLHDFKSRFGFDLTETFSERIPALIDGGFLDLDQNFLRLSQKGVLISNSIMAEFM